MRTRRQPRRGKGRSADRRTRDPRGAASAVRSSDRRNPTIAILTVALGAILPYAQTLLFGFTNWDDDINVTQNPYVNPPSWAGLGHHWTHAYRSLYVPLAYTTFALDGFAGGGRPGAFHLSNVLLHGGASVAVLLTVHLLLARRPSERAPATHIGGWTAAGAAALAFAWHPVQVEPVSWITGRKDVLSGCLALRAAWCYLRC